MRIRGNTMPLVKPIPERWRRCVCDALDSEEPARILATQRAIQDWESTFPSAFRYDLYLTLSDTLKDEQIEGSLVAMLGADETYQFFFFFDNRKMYAKVGLKDNSCVVFIFSAHIPLRGDKL